MDPNGITALLITLGTVVFTLVLGLVITVSTVASIAIPFWLFWKIASAAQAEQKRLLETGVAAPARVVSLAETGMYINHQPQIRLVLEVVPLEGAPFTATVDRVTSILEIPRLQPGATVEVRFDRENPKKLVISALGAMG